MIIRLQPRTLASAMFSGLLTSLLVMGTVSSAQQASEAKALPTSSDNFSYSSPDATKLYRTFAPTQVEVTPFIWALHINSDDNSGTTALNSDLALSRILSSLKGLAELEVAVRKRNVVLFGDGIYASLQLKPRLAIPMLGHTNLQSGFATFATGYAFGPFHVAGQGQHATYANIQPFAGAEYTDIDVTARTATPTTLLHVAQEWWMPVVGARLDGQSGRYLMRVEGDFSEFGSNQNGEQLLGAVGYQFRNPRAGAPALRFGYRYLYEKKGVDSLEISRLKLQGPIVFVTFHFH